MRPGVRGQLFCALFILLALPGCGVLAAPPGYDRDTRAYNLAHGRVVFKQHCLRCHGKGHMGAPIPGNPESWKGRLDQPLSVLVAHAIEGHGDMPARGETDLADREIASAVAYVVSRARIVLAEQVAAVSSSTDSDIAKSVESGPVDDAVVHMFLLLMSKDRWK